jgi:hypothetical protein
MRISTFARVRPTADSIELGSYINNREGLKLPSIGSPSSTAPPNGARSPFRPSSNSCVSISSANTLSVSTSSFSYLSSIITGSDQLTSYSTLGSPIEANLRANLNCTIVAYGQTGSGKTYTMFGPAGALTQDSLLLANPSCPPPWGIFPRTVFNLLTLGDYDTIAISGIEIFQEIAYDLLNSRRPLQIGNEQVPIYAPGARTSVLHEKGPKGGNGTHPPGCRCQHCWTAKKAAVADRLKRRDSGDFKPNAGTAAKTGITEDFKTVGETVTRINSVNDIPAVASTIEATRIAASHNLNDRSSRSHCIITVHLSRSSNGKVMKQMLTFVDLAGSERVGKSGASGQALVEAASINSSLTTLGMVIHALGSNSKHIPYRDSKLTKLLKAQLSGKSKVYMCICIADGAEHSEESVCSLKFGGRCSVVQNVGREEEYGEVGGGASGTVSERLEMARLELNQLEQRGMGETFGTDSAPSEIASYKANCAKLEELKVSLVSAQKENFEANAKAKRMGGKESRGSRKIDQRAKDLAETVNTLKKDVKNIGDIILRQKSIKGFVRAPNQLYVRKMAEVRELEQLLSLE